MISLTKALYSTQEHQGVHFALGIFKNMLMSSFFCVRKKFLKNFQIFHSLRFSQKISPKTIEIFAELRNTYLTRLKYNLEQRQNRAKLIIIIIYFIGSQIHFVLLFQNTLQSELHSQKDLPKHSGFSRGDLVAGCRL